MQQMQLRTIRIFSMYRPLRTVEAPVYICLCNALTDRDLRPHTLGGASSVSMVYRACGCQPQCGKCVPFVRQMLRDNPDAVSREAAGAD